MTKKTAAKNSEENSRDNALRVALAQLLNDYPPVGWRDSEKVALLIVEHLDSIVYLLKTTRGER
jgi:hypothetical protein